MQVVILIGIQGSGKSTFCRKRFFDTHVRINLDMLRTRPPTASTAWSPSPAPAGRP